MSSEMFMPGCCDRCCDQETLSNGGNERVKDLISTICRNCNKNTIISKICISTNNCRDLCHRWVEPGSANSPKTRDKKAFVHLAVHSYLSYFQNWLGCWSSFGSICGLYFAFIARRSRALIKTTMKPTCHCYIIAIFMKAPLYFSRCTCFYFYRVQPYFLLKKVFCIITAAAAAAAAARGSTHPLPNGGLT